MLKKLIQIMTYHDSEPTEVLQGLIWFIFAPIVLEATFFPDLWYVALVSVIIGFSTLYSVVYLSLEIRKYVAYSYGLLALCFVYIYFRDNGFHSNPMNWGWVVISISALSNIRRINQKIESKVKDTNENDISKMYREDLENKIQELQKENFNLRLKNIEISENLNK